jgi:hypothetical protein
MILMWPFKRNKLRRGGRGAGFPCSYCRSTNTRVKSGYTSEQPNYVKTWRGQRYVTCRCYDCGQDFYVEEPSGGLDIEAAVGDEIVADEEALQEAEDELRRQIDEEDDRRCR